MSGLAGFSWHSDKLLEKEINAIMQKPEKIPPLGKEFVIKETKFMVKQ